MAKRLEGNVAQQNDGEGQLLEVGVERRQSVGLLSITSISKFINWLKFFCTSVLTVTNKKLIVYSFLLLILKCSKFSLICGAVSEFTIIVRFP
jgi:hypothetical protein